MNVKRMAILNIYGERLREFLHLPEGTIFLDCRLDQEVFGMVRFVIEHPDLKPVGEGDYLPKVSPSITTIHAIPEKMVFKGWNQ